MYDGIKIQDLSVSVDLLLTNDRLTFALPIDEQTGAILNQPRRANDRGLTFTLIPRVADPLGSNTYRVEVKGSIHRFYNESSQRAALGNSTDFTANNLLSAIDRFVTTYKVDPFGSKLNNVEFGVNVRLPFPVSHVLNNLVCYKNRPFTRDTRSPVAYYQCQTQRYIVKLYDKGHQYGLNANILRVEVKVEKMEYLTRKGINLNTLSDLLTVSNYGRLGELLVSTFSEILFDSPTVARANLTPIERSLYQNGRNPKFWHIPSDLTKKQADAHRQRLHRAEGRYRALINRYEGNQWQDQTATLIGETWGRLTTVTDDLLTRIEQHRAAWQNLTKPHIFTNAKQANSCDRAAIKPPKSTGPNRMDHGMNTTWKHPKTALQIPINNSGEIPGNHPETTGLNKANYCERTVKDYPENCHKLTDTPTGEMSRINPLYLVLNCDTSSTPNLTQPGAAVCPVTGVSLPTTTGRGRGVRRFVTATILHTNDDLLMQLNSRFRQYAKGSKEDQYSRVAHNVRNVESNFRNNLRKRINRLKQQPALFDLADTVRLTTDQRAALNYWQGTPYQVRL